MEIVDGKKQLELPDSVKAAALKAERRKGWTLDDVPEDHDLTDAQAKDMWALFECAISDAVAADKALSTPALPVLSATDMKRAKMWFVARTVQVDDVLDEVPNKTLPEGERALTQSRRKEPSLTVTDVTDTKPTPPLQQVRTL